MQDLGIQYRDTVQFTFKAYRIIVSGRIKHYICFCEHVIGKEVESALQEAMQGTNVRVNEFTVAPNNAI
jgi:metal-sulfur cluster biosynthetic enzyme